MSSFKIRIVVLVCLIVLLFGGGIFWWQLSLSAINPADKKPRIFVIQKGDGVREIATRLKNDGLIRDQIAFFLLVKINNLDQKLQAGDYRLSPSMDVTALAQVLTKGMNDIWITILEGWRDEEIALKFAADLSIPENQFLKYAQEGRMFPDTYLIPKESTAGAVVQILKENFNNKFTSELQKEATKTGLTVNQVLILASIVEKEASGEKDRSVIAGILLKRLKKDWPLQVDATVQYALGYQPEERSWWKKAITNFDKKIKSPYNTYENTGLPPGPICNPGLASIGAAVSPQDSVYWFYLHDPEGNVHYAKTMEEHEANIAKYL
ncbi:MAG: endolytic transglycosylase MltG [Candidatus Gottesmanbacteria bacterium]